MTNVWRIPFVIGGLARLAVAAGMVLAPEWTGGRLAPKIQGHPGARMNSRGMGGTKAPSPSTPWRRPGRRRAPGLP
jgi:hypothetical protein